MRCLNPITLNQGKGITVSCGHCMACRINYTTAWKLRLLYELSNWDKAMFLTLTYNNDNVPEDFSLQKKDPVGFFKRLRAYLAYSNDDRRIKYYCCGEYGEKLDPLRPDKKHGRPHYHAIIFGLSPYDENDRKLVVEAWQHRCDDWQFDRMRGKKCAIQNVTPVDIEYVTGYVQKKLNGAMASDKYGSDTPPFAIMSKGLGLEFAVHNADRLRTNGFTYINGHRICLPRYYRNKLEIIPDYTKMPDINPKHFQEDYEYIKGLFDNWLKQHGQYEAYYKASTDKELERTAQLFEKFYENHRDMLAHQVYKDFADRQRLRNGL